MSFERQIREFVSSKADEARGHVQLFEVVEPDPLAVRGLGSALELDEEEIALASHVRAFSEDPGLEAGDSLLAVRLALPGDDTWLAIAVDSTNEPSGSAGGPTGYTELIGDGASASIDVEHGLGTWLLLPQIWVVSTGAAAEAGFQRIDPDTLRVTFDDPPATDSLRIVIGRVTT